MPCWLLIRNRLRRVDCFQERPWSGDVHSCIPGTVRKKPGEHAYVYWGTLVCAPGPSSWILADAFLYEGSFTSGEAAVSKVLCKGQCQRSVHRTHVNMLGVAA